MSIYDYRYKAAAVNFALTATTKLVEFIPQAIYTAAKSAWNANANYFGVRDIVKFTERCNLVTSNGSDYSQDVYHVCQSINFVKNLPGIKHALDGLNNLKAPDYLEKPAAEAWKNLGDIVASGIEKTATYTESIPNISKNLQGLAESIRYNTDYISYNQDGQYNLLSVNAVRGVVFHSVIARGIAFWELNSASNDLLAKQESIDAKTAKAITIGFAGSAIYHTQVESNLEEALDNLKLAINKCSVPHSCPAQELFSALDKYNHNDSPRSVFVGDTIAFPALWSLNSAIHGRISYLDPAKTYYKNAFLPTFVGKLYDTIDGRREKIEDILTEQSQYYDGNYWSCRDLLAEVAQAENAQ